MKPVDGCFMPCQYPEKPKGSGTLGKGGKGKVDGASPSVLSLGPTGGSVLAPPQPPPLPLEAPLPALPAAVAATEDAFAQLLQRVGEQHRREVQALQATIRKLQSPLGAAPGQQRSIDGMLLPPSAAIPRSQTNSVEVQMLPPPSAAKPRSQTKSVEVQVDARELLLLHGAAAPANTWSAASWCATGPTDGNGGRGPHAALADVPLREPRPDTMPLASGFMKEGSLLAGPQVSQAGALPAKQTTLDSSFVRVALDQEGSDEVFGRYTHYFEMGVAIGVVLNIVIIFTRLEYLGSKAAVEAGMDGAQHWPDMDGFFIAMHHVFCLCFLGELVARLYVLRWAYFYVASWQWFNIMDAGVVAISVFETYILAAFLAGQQTNLNVLRALRFFRCLRALRIFRTFEIFSQLRVLVATVAASFFALFWSMFLVFVIMLVSSILLCEMIIPYIEEGRHRPETIEWMFKYYGTAGRSLWTLFMLTFSGGWPTYVHRLVEEVSIVFAFFFATYVSTVIFAMTRIITALFLKETLEAAADDAERTAKRRLKNIFVAADVSKDGRISLQEFQEIMAVAKVRSYLAALGVETDNPKQLFKMLDDGDGGLTIDEFMAGTSKMKGTAKAQDMKSIISDVKHLETVVGSVQEILESRQGAATSSGR